MEIEVQKAKAQTEKEGAAASTSCKRKQPASSSVVVSRWLQSMTLGISNLSPLAQS